jgi:glycopeptide antibiotics resistance protein
MPKKGVFLILFFVIAAIFYYSWIPDPGFSKETYLPKWILNWSNEYYNLRTCIPFIAVGFLLEDIAHQMSSIEYYNKSLNFIQNIAISIIIVCVAEGGQILIQKRNPDLIDVFYGILGSFIGGLLYYLQAMLCSFKRFRNEK